MAAAPGSTPSAPGQPAPSSQVQCGPPAVTPRPRRDRPLLAVPTAGGETRLYADETSGTENRFQLSGNVQIDRRDQELQADTVIFDKDKNRADAQGNVYFTQPGLTVSGDSGYTQVRGDEAQFNHTQYELTDYNARGKAETIHKLDDSRSVLTQATFTTCPPQKKDWELQASQVKLNRAEGVGKARNVKLLFKDVPILYVPRMTFPIDNRRKSGFLAPSIGSSNNTGASIRVPYYWNIAPNQDATIAPRLMSKRGVQLQGEYRYLTQYGHGELGVEYLPSDNIYKGDRSLFSFQHQGSFAPHWSADVNLNGVSDDRYFTDLGQSLSVSSITYLERRVDVNYNRGPWSVLGRVQTFQPIGTIAEPYQRLPQLVAQADIPGANPALTYHLYGEAVRFGIDAKGMPTGTRLDLNPGVSYEFRGPSWYATPKLSVRHTQYALSDAGAGNPSNPSRTTPIASLDTGMYFERDTRWGDRPFVQTLEPRLYYLYVPYKDQSNFPVFDTTALDFNFAQLFRDNRFSGADRQGDANQLTAALTTRYLDQTSGRERLRASIGQIYYFRNRRVTLPGNPVDTGNRSSFVAEAGVGLWQNNWVTAGVQWDPKQRQTEKGTFLWHYQSDSRHILNLAYRYRHNDIRQTDVSMLWPMAPGWNAIARWNYSLRDKRTLEALAGVEHDTCCWTVRVVARRYVTTVSSTSNTGIYVELVLKGLTSVGKGVEDLLDRGILGYGGDAYLN